jgi:hypothetical protein
MMEKDLTRLINYLEEARVTLYNYLEESRGHNSLNYLIDAGVILFNNLITDWRTFNLTGRNNRDSVDVYLPVESSL